MRLALLLVLAAAGCNSILGIGDVHLGSGGPGTPDAAGDAAGDAAPDAPPNTLVGTSVITYVKADGTTVMKNEDLTGYTIGAYYVDGQVFTYQHVVGSGTSDGHFTVTGVPEHATNILLELTRPNDPSPQLYAVDTRTIDAGWVTLGRPDGVSTTLTTPVALNITGMTPWQDGDVLLADSYATGTENAVAYGSPNPTWTSPPAIGATSLMGSFDWKSGYTYDASGAPPRLIQAAAGDDFYLQHASTQVVNDQQGDPIVVFQLVDLYQANGVDMTDGSSTPVAGAFTHLVADQSQALTLNLNQYRALAGDGGRFADEVFECDRLTNYAIAYGGRIGPAVWEVNGTLDAATSGVTISGMYANPFPSSWASLFECDYEHYRLYRLPGGQLVNWISAETFEATATSSVYASPLLGAPTNAFVEDQPFLAGGRVAFDAQAINVQWEAVPGAAYYVVRVIRNYLNGTTGAGQSVVTISTPKLAVAIPPTLLKKGELYTVSLTAVHANDPTAFVQGHLRRDGFPIGTSSVFSGLFRFSSDCGNSNVDSGEQCDTGGDSAACDADCSMATCGDGYINTAAGEVCDNVTDTETCDRDCTAPKCSDGLLNLQAGEACDDSNLVDGDGCSAACQVETGWTCDGASPSHCTMTMTAPRKNR